MYSNEDQEETICTKEWEAKIKVDRNKKKIVFKIDTGADVCVMNSRSYQKLSNKPKLMQSDRKLIGASGPIQIKGMFTSNLSSKGKTYNCNMYMP